MPRVTRSKSEENRIHLLAGERKEGESDAAATACNDYLRMGPMRSVPELHRQYTKLNPELTPTQSLNHLRQMAMVFDWTDRALEYDLEVDQRKTEFAKKELETGLAMPFERVRKLKKLADTLEKELYEKDEDGVMYKIWLKRYKQIGHGIRENVEIVEEREFNGALVQQFRGVLDDLAKETGGRRQNVSVSGDEDQPLTVKVIRGVSMSDL